jgi:hypothetical protein
LPPRDAAGRQPRSGKDDVSQEGKKDGGEESREGEEQGGLSQEGQEGEEDSCQITGSGKATGTERQAVI